MAAAPIVSVSDLKKTYKSGVEAVKGVSFELREGEIFGFLGPNGAGKTTTIKMLTTILEPTGGGAEVCGLDVAANPAKVRECIGIVFQEPAIDHRLTGRENLDFHARLYGMDQKQRKERMAQVMELVDLQGAADQLVKNYSGGMKRRLELARGLMHRPKVLFLDEPTLGLDVQTRRKTWDYIRTIKEKENMTVLMTTHYMEEAEQVCDRVAIIDHGQILKTGTVRELINQACEGGVVAVKTQDHIKKIKGVKKIHQNGEWTELAVKDPRSVTRVVRELLKGYEVEEVSIRRPSLEEVFVKLTGKSIRESKPEKRMGKMHRMGRGRRR